MKLVLVACRLTSRERARNGTKGSEIKFSASRPVFLSPPLQVNQMAIECNEKTCRLPLELGTPPSGVLTPLEQNQPDLIARPRKPQVTTQVGVTVGLGFAAQGPVVRHQDA